eukprot:scpid43229/ scgid9586/ 
MVQSGRRKIMARADVCLIYGISLLLVCVSLCAAADATGTGVDDGAAGVASTTTGTSTTASTTATTTIVTTTPTAAVTTITVDPLLLIDANATVICSANTTSLLHLTAQNVPIPADDKDLVWLVDYWPTNVLYPKPIQDARPFNASEPVLALPHFWDCPGDRGVWNVSVRVCEESSPGFGCPEPSDSLARNETAFTIKVGLASSLAPVGSGTFACSNGTKSTINISAMVYVPNGEDWQPIPLRYEFDFRRPKVQPLLVGGPVSARRSVVAVMRSNDTSVTLHQPWVCGDYESGTWDVILQVRNDVDNTLLAYASATIFVTKHRASLTVNGSLQRTFSCSSDSPLILRYTSTGTGQEDATVTLQWVVTGTTPNVTIYTPPEQNFSGTVVYSWPCPQAYGLYTITLQLLNVFIPIDRLQAETEVSIGVTVLLSSDMAIQQHSHNHHRYHSPMAVGELAFSVRNLLVKDTNRTVEEFFGGAAAAVGGGGGGSNAGKTSLQIYYDWVFDDGVGNTTTTQPNITYSYERTGVYSPRVTVRAMSIGNYTLGLQLAAGTALFPPLSVVAYVSSVDVDGPHDFEVGEFGTNYTLTCVLSSDTDIIPTSLCWNLTLVESNSSLNVPYYSDCDIFNAVSIYNRTFGHAFNVTGIYQLAYNCSNAVSRTDELLEIEVNNAPVPPKVPVVSYTLPVVLTMVFGLAGFGLLGFLVYRHRKNRHIQVAEFDYLLDWEQPRPRTLKDRFIEWMGGVCGCLPGPWHWRKSQRTQRYLSLTSRSNDSNYGSTQSYSMSMS